MNKFPIFCLEPYPQDTSLCICKHFKIQKFPKLETEPAPLISNRDALSVNTRQRMGNTRHSSSAFNVAFTNPHELHQPQATSMGSGRELDLRFRIPVKGGCGQGLLLIFFSVGGAKCAFQVHFSWVTEWRDHMPVL